jgi:hypothetical protein
MIKKILFHLKVIQIVSNKNRIIKLGRGFNDAKRLNPYNPLSYLTLLVVLLVGMVAFGIIGFWKEVDTTNPFKWN